MGRRLTIFLGTSPYDGVLSPLQEEAYGHDGDVLVHVLQRRNGSEFITPRPNASLMRCHSVFNAAAITDHGRPSGPAHVHLLAHDPHDAGLRRAAHVDVQDADLETTQPWL